MHCSTYIASHHSCDLSGSKLGLHDGMKWTEATRQHETVLFAVNNAFHVLSLY